MGVHSVYTDAMYIHINKGLKCSLTETDEAIAVSHICKENLTLRACLNPDGVHVIPNAVDTTKFRPPQHAKASHNDQVTVVMMQRMAFRKGIHLAVRVIPRICRRFARVRFVIGGDGPCRVQLEQMLAAHPSLAESARVKLLGAVPHIGVRDVLRRGDVFLNCSLTESFCIANLEAACCGLYVVSTDVGGVPEVLLQFWRWCYRRTALSAPLTSRRV